MKNTPHNTEYLQKYHPCCSPLNAPRCFEDPHSPLSRFFHHLWNEILHLRKCRQICYCPCWPRPKYTLHKGPWSPIALQGVARGCKKEGVRRKMRINFFS